MSENIKINDTFTVNLKESDRLVHTIEYGGKSIPIYYNVEKIRDRLEECTEIIRLFLSYMEENKLVLTDKQKKILMADEVISSSYIEGYETYLTPNRVIEGYSYGSLADKATLSGYSSYCTTFNSDKSMDEVLTTGSILSIWRELVGYKKFFIKNFRKTGVKVGNRRYTAHIAPPAKYVKNLLNDMFETLSTYKKENIDNFDLIRSILFHYIYTFIHPFLDGNGRSARLIENIMINRSNDFDFCIPLSGVILSDKKKYYSGFTSGQYWGNDVFDILRIDISDFICVNLFFLQQGVINILSILKIKKEMKDNLELYTDEFKDILDFTGNADKTDVKNLMSFERYCNLVFYEKIKETEFGIEFKFTDIDSFFELREEKWKEANNNANSKN